MIHRRRRPLLGRALSLLLVAAPVAVHAAPDREQVCFANRVRASGDMCNAALKCASVFAKRAGTASGGELQACLERAQTRFEARVESASRKVGDRCGAADAELLADAHSERAADLLGDVLVGLDASDRRDRSARAAVLGQLGGYCRQLTRAHAAELRSPRAGARLAAIPQARERFARRALRVLERAQARGADVSAIVPQALADRVESTLDPVLRPLEVHVLSRAGYGPDPASLARIRELGVYGYLDEQLNPERVPDDAYQAIRAARFAPLDLAYRDLYLGYSGGTGTAELLTLATYRNITRASVGRRQLEAVLADFWWNHFNVYVRSGPRRWDFIPYERDSIAPRIWGPFRELVLATARAPAMLDYLDNFANLRKGGNENYARELLELHTIGVDAGYTQGDVVEAARALTGWGLDYDAATPTASYRLSRTKDGFRFRPEHHDSGARSLFGGQLQIEADQGEQAGVELIRFLTGLPQAARHICLKLAVRFVADEPPAQLVEDCVATYLARDGDLRAVVGSILTSPIFLYEPSLRGNKVKRPLVLVASLIRALRIDPTYLTGHYRFMLDDLGEMLYLASPPTGYPDDAIGWASPGGVAVGLRRIDDLVRGRMTGRIELGISGGSDAEIVDFLIERIFPAGAPDGVRGAALAYLAALAPASDRERVEAAAVALLSTPAFLQH